MKAYRVFWLLFCGVLGALGAVMAFTWSLTNVIMLLILAALTGAVVAMVALADPDGPGRPPRDRRRIVATSTALAAGGTVSFVGLGNLVGAATAVLLLAIIVGGSPYAIRRCLHWLTEHGHLASPPPRSVRQDRADRPPRSAPAPILGIEPDDASKPRIAPGALSDAALCVAWRASFSALQRAGSPTQRLQVVDDRRAYLDEIERRTAHGMAAWLASGPRAAGDPSRFVLGDGAASRAAIDWDDLLHDMDS
ncbi:hypothetical protein EV651_10429 [Kribbella sp. VKM Ac-2571]|uniref:hypothetical protein n=1 Tax=Kribbella sp. VKM Ac-2571 TaxID=2512222 RepID=UPI00106109FE|nr:hypothetical protein [Kribbella sp. VKM Ac-2571]TDO66464.1 hypothetical protein EV651_10429 [Kribbella sp. VKM Ac-2571]